MMSAGRLCRAIRKLANHGHPAAIGIITGLGGVGVYRVQLGGAEITVPAVGGASALTGQSVAVLLDTETGQAIGMLGSVKL
jgi:hypothetical protein